MSRPLPPGDPVQLGPYRLSARLSESSAGIVYLGVDGAGRRASVAVLNRGAAGDAAARDRFRAAITAGLPGAPGAVGPRGGGEAGSRVAVPVAGGVSPVVAAQREGPSPWVATAFDPDRVGAERFLESVLLEETYRGRWGGRRRGPQFQPHWLGSGEPAWTRPPVPSAVGPVPVQRRERGLVAAILTLAGVLVVLALLMLVLFACQPRVEQPPPPPPEPTRQQSTPPSPTPGETPPRPPPSPSPPTSPGSPSPGPTGTDPGEDGAPL